MPREAELKHVLVTGGNGFIGRYVVEELDRRGYQTYVLDRKRSFTAGWSVNREHYFGDIKDATLVSEAVSHVDGVIHLAGVLGTQETIENPLPAAETNILGGLNVIGACAQYDVPLVNIAVGNWWMDNTYSITKNTVERLVAMTAKYRGKTMTSVRALNAYGPRQVPVPPYGPSRVRKIMPSFICRALSGLPIEVYGEGDQVMDMVYVADVASILVSTLEMLDGGQVPVKTIEAGTGRKTTVKDIANIVAQEVRTQAKVGTIINFLPMRPGEDEHSVVLGDPETLLQIHYPKDSLITLEEGVAKTVAYFKEYLDG